MRAGGEVPVDPVGLDADVVSIGWVGRGELGGACEDQGILCEGMFETLLGGCTPYSTSLVARGELRS